MRATRARRFLLVLVGAALLLGGAVTGSSAVTAPLPRGFQITNASGNVSVTAGGVASFTIAITRTRFTGPVSFSILGIPPDTTAAFTPVATSANSTLLTITTTIATPPGSYFPVVTGRSGTFESSSTSVHLTASGPRKPPFAISGNVDVPLSPGVTGHINLALRNPNDVALDVSALSVSLIATSKPGCIASNFRVGQYSGAYPLVIPAESTRTLAQLGVPRASWPTLAMIDLATNQDICKHISLTLAYSGSGHGT